MYRFLVKPRWILFHVMVVVLAVTMVNLAFWQLRRLDERRQQNRDVRDRGALSIEPVDALVTAGPPMGGHQDIEWRRVSAAGTYDVAHQVLVRDRSQGGQAGFHVLTPLVTAGGPALVVNRGFVPFGNGHPDIPTPPSGSVSVVGRVRPTQVRSGLGPRDPANGVLTDLARADLARYQQQLPYPIYPVYVELLSSVPATTTDFPALIPPPALDEGPHLSYAVQWFIFSAMAVIGWVVIVRKSAREGGQWKRPRRDPTRRRPGVIYDEDDDDAAASAAGPASGAGNVEPDGTDHPVRSGP